MERQFVVYYSSVLPVKLVERYLTLIYNPYSLENVDFMITFFQQDLPSRYNSWDMVVKKLARKGKMIMRIDMGGVFKDRDISLKRFLAPVNDSIMLGKPLVFDVDKYPAPRICCKETKTACKDCFRLHIIPCFEQIVSVLEATLPPNFSFNVFYSGGRGLHVHVRGSMQYAPLGFLEREGIVRGVFKAFSDMKIGVVFDEEVSRQIKHCIRMPFSIHENTGRVALPLNRKLIKWNNQFPMGNIKKLLKKENNMAQFWAFNELLSLHLFPYSDAKLKGAREVNMATEIVSSFFSLLQ